MLTEPVTCSTCGAVSVNGGTLHCHGCYTVATNQRAILEARVAELEAANDRMREVIASQPLNSPTRLEAIAKILATVEPK